MSCQGLAWLLLHPCAAHAETLELKMARTLDARHTEDPETSRLFNLFLLIAMGVMVLAMVSNAASADNGTNAEVPQEIFFQ